MSEQTSIAVVGTGVGQEHLAALATLPGAYRIAAICDIDPSRARRTASRFGARPESSLDRVLEDDAIDVVDLCTPPMLHEPQILAALQRGKHVICEKPLVGSLAAVDRIEQAASSAGRAVFPVYNYRFGLAYQQFLEVATAGRLGAALVATIEVGFRRGKDYYRTPWRGTKAGELGGCLAVHAIHHFDMLLTALGPATAVSARTSTRVNDIETEDCAVGTMEFSNGAFASFAVSLGCIEEYSRIRLIFERGVVEFGPGPYAALGETDWYLAGPDRPPDHQRRETGFQRMFREIHLSLAGRANSAPTIDEARCTLELLTALYQAAAGGGVASLPIERDSDWYQRWKD